MQIFRVLVFISVPRAPAIVVGTAVQLVLGSRTYGTPPCWVGTGVVGRHRVKDAVGTELSMAETALIPMVVDHQSFLLLFAFIAQRCTKIPSIGRHAPVRGSRIHLITAPQYLQTGVWDLKSAISGSP